MSLKAYDGLICRKSFFHIQSELQKAIPKLREISENELAKTYAEMVLSYVDDGIVPTENINVKVGISNNEDSKIIPQKINDIKLEEVSLLSVIYQISNIISKSKYMTSFSVQLDISIEAVNNRKTLLYPHLYVQEHKKVLLEIFDDWHAQNQCDKPEEISHKQWNQREKDWYGFGEIEGMKTIIQIFNPENNYGFDSINRRLRGEELINKILKFIESDNSRKKKIAIKELYERDLENNAEETKRAKEEKSTSYFYKMRRKWFNKDKENEIEQYIKDNNITVTEITKEFLEEKRNFL